MSKTINAAVPTALASLVAFQIFSLSCAAARLRNVSSPITEPALELSCNSAEALKTLSVKVTKAPSADPICQNPSQNNPNQNNPNQNNPGQNSPSQNNPAQSKPDCTTTSQPSKEATESNLSSTVNYAGVKKICAIMVSVGDLSPQQGSRLRALTLNDRLLYASSLDAIESLKKDEAGYIWDAGKLTNATLKSNSPYCHAKDGKCTTVPAEIGRLAFSLPEAEIAGMNSSIVNKTAKFSIQLSGSKATKELESITGMVVISYLPE